MYTNFYYNMHSVYKIEMDIYRYIIYYIFYKRIYCMRPRIAPIEY